MTVEEELDKLELYIRQLKIEFDVFFNGASRQPPHDTQRRVEKLLKKFSEGTGFTFAHRFRYNGLAQRYAAFSSRWRQRIKSMEEGPRQKAAKVRAPDITCREFQIEGTFSTNNLLEIDELFLAFREAKQTCGEATENMEPETFRRFVRQKTDQLRRDFQCKQVEYSVRVHEGRAILKAKAR